MKFSTRCCARLGLVAAFVVLATSVSTLLLVPRYSRPVAVADVGTLAPDFELPDARGGTFHLSETRGQVVVLVFGSLTSTSSEHSGHVDRLARHFADDARVKVLGINLGGGEQLDPLLLNLDQRISTRSYPTLLDDKAFVATRYAATQTPLMVVIDPRGVVRYRGAFDNSPDVAFASAGVVADAINGMLEKASLTVVSK